MANSKRTQKDFFNDIIALAEENGRDDLADFARGRIEVIENKAKNKKPSKASVENEEFGKLVMNVVSDEGMTFAEIKNAVPEFAEFSPQKMSAIIRPLKNANLVEVYKEKKVTYVKAM